MTNDWKHLGLIASGGTVFNIANDTTGRVWLGTGAGVFYQDDNQWIPVSTQPLSQISALNCIGSMVLVGGGQGELVTSNDGGQTWFQGQIGRSNYERPFNGEPITWFTPSPNFEEDSTIFAGTNGAGVLKSTDKGRTWYLSNLRLRDLSVIALATTPSWRHRKIIFAATAKGLHRSFDAGRSWERWDLGIDDLAILSIALSPNFEKDGTMFVGTEEHGIFKSLNRGKNWQAYSEGITHSDETGNYPPINGIWLHPEYAKNEVCLAATGEGDIFRSSDRGLSWQSVASDQGPVLSIGGNSKQIYAGLHHQGLLVSEDTGETWQPTENLAGRPINRLEAMADRLWAFSPWEGIWCSSDQGTSWQAILGVTDKFPILTLAAQAETLFVGTSQGLLRTDDQGQTWQSLLDTDQIEVTRLCFSETGSGWAGTSQGLVYQTTDDGKSWQVVYTPKKETPIIALEALPALTLPEAKGREATHVLLAGTYDIPTKRATVWASADDGATWKQLMQVETALPSIQIAVVNERAIIAIGKRCWRATSSGWERNLEAENTINRLLPLPSGSLLALTPSQLFRTEDGTDWETIEEPARRSLIDVAVMPDQSDQTLYVLELGGVVWKV